MSEVKRHFVCSHHSFTAKMLALRPKSVPGWAIPLLGGLLFTALAGLWLTSALWFFTTTGVTR